MVIMQKTKIKTSHNLGFLAILAAFAVCLPISVHAENLQTLKNVQLAQNQLPSSQSKTLSLGELEWVGQRIYMNECAAKPENLLHWNKGEEFPSLGIGHFIWYPQNVSGPFTQTFPQMVDYVGQFVRPPVWLIQLKQSHSFKAPWQSAAEFAEFKTSNQAKKLQNWLLHTKAYQAEFITTQFNKKLALYFQTHGNQQQADLKHLVARLQKFKAGRFALIDYVNFKGVGDIKEAYQGEQWGLISVLQQLIKDTPNHQQLSHQVLLNQFVAAAKKRLALRVELSPPARGEQRWLKGWFKRLDGYVIAD